jgi:hypothetical protein
MAFRTLLPLTPDTLWMFKPAADGQLGTVMKAYREWLQCGDRAWLSELWPGVVRALEHAWKPGSWDADRDGVMEGEQHNTYDIEFHGPNTMCGLFYLGALRAAEELARVLGEDARAMEYRSLFESGRRKYAELLWNGAYFTQQVVPPAGHTGEEPRYQYGPGCLSDQVLGQWFARVVDLGDLLPPEMIRGAVGAIVRHNFREDLTDHACVQRAYAVNEDGGLLACSWPNGGRPRYPFPYADEVWTGIEYHVAAHCIYEGLIEEGLRIVAAARERHDGAKRNPWDECECGHHYARAMSSWSLVLALSGYHFDASAGLLRFAPKVSVDDFRCFFTAGTAWGTFTQKRTDGGFRAALEPAWGEVTLRVLDLPLGDAASVHVTVDCEAVAASVDGGAMRLGEPLTLRAGQRLVVEAG